MAGWWRDTPEARAALAEETAILAESEAFHEAVSDELVRLSLGGKPDRLELVYLPVLTL